MFSNARWRSRGRNGGLSAWSQAQARRAASTGAGRSSLAAATPVTASGAASLTTDDPMVGMSRMPSCRLSGGVVSIGNIANVFTNSGSASGEAAICMTPVVFSNTGAISAQMLRALIAGLVSRGMPPVAAVMWSDPSRRRLASSILDELFGCLSSRSEIIVMEESRLADASALC